MTIDGRKVCVTGLAVRLLACAMLVSLIVPRRAFGYIDPLSGSIVLQVLAAGLMAATLSIRRLRDWLKGLLQSAFRRRG
jgi:hypothetical protein